MGLCIHHDIQSNRTLPSSKLFDLLGIKGHNVEYIQNVEYIRVPISCAGKERAAGWKRKMTQKWKSMDQFVRLQLSAVTKSSHLPNIREEIPREEVAQNHTHILDIAQYMPPLDDSVQIMLLISRDVIQALHVLDQRTGSAYTPYAQKLPLE